MATIKDFITKGGITTGGAVTLPSDPTLALHASTKQYVDGKVAGSGSFLADGSVSMTGNLKLATGTAVLGPLKFTVGTNLTTPVSGTVEFDGTNYYFTNGSNVRKTMAFTDTTITGNAANVTGTVAIANGGTGATVAASALANLGGVALAGSTMTGALVLNADPVQALGAATKQYVDSIAQSLDVKASVRVASIANVVIATGGLIVIDGIQLVAGDRVLLKDQTTASENGIYVANAGAWTRAIDANSAVLVTPGLFTFIEDGAINANAGFVLTTKAPITLGTTALSFSQFSGAGQIIAGNGITKSGNMLSVVGTANRVTVSGSGVDIAATFVGQSSITTLGLITTGTWNGATVDVAHGGTGATTLTGYVKGAGTAALTSSTTIPNTDITGLGTMSTQNASAVAVNGGAINGTTIGATTASTGAFTSLSTTGAATLASVTTANATVTGGSVNGTSVGATTASTGKFTNLTATSVMSLNSIGDMVTASTAVATTVATTVDSFATAAYRSAKYQVQIVDGTSFETVEFLVIHDGLNVFITTYSNVFTSANSLGNFDATIATGTLTVTYTATAATAKTVKLVRITIAV